MNFKILNIDTHPKKYLLCETTLNLPQERDRLSTRGDKPSKKSKCND